MTARLAERPMGATPGPWESPGTDGDARVVCAIIAGKRRTVAHIYGTSVRGSMEANAAFIVRACNSHAALVAALEALDERLRKCFDDPISAREAYDSFYQEIVSEALALARQA